MDDYTDYIRITCNIVYILHVDDDQPKTLETKNKYNDGMPTNNIYTLYLVLAMYSQPLHYIIYFSTIKHNNYFSYYVCTDVSDCHY